MALTGTTVAKLPRRVVWWWSLAIIGLAPSVVSDSVSTLMAHFQHHCLNHTFLFHAFLFPIARFTSNRQSHFQSPIALFSSHLTLSFQ
jgi:hypothetical protein